MSQGFTRSCRRGFAALAVGFWLAAPTAAAPEKPPLQAGYATAPLAEPVFDVARVAGDSAAFDQWLSQNYEKLGAERMQGPREHLFYLIDSHVKHLYASRGVVVPAQPDPTLSTLFAWAERLGVYGGAQVYNATRPPGSAQQPTRLAVPPDLSLELDGDAFVLGSRSGQWSVAFPYYFMPWKLSDFEASNGMRTQVLGLSTGAHAHRGVEGHSQATLMLIFSPAADHEAFSDHWTRQFGVGQELAPGVTDLTGVRTKVLYDPVAHLHSELVLWQRPQGSFALLYSGVEGTYEWNRAHFLDFFRSLRSSDSKPASADPEAR